MVVWDSQALEYSGRYVISLLNEDGTSAGVEGQEIQLYSTAQNLKSEIWIDDLAGIFPLKSKFSLSGNSNLFKSSSLNFDSLTNNLSSLTLPTPAPSSAGLSITKDRGYIRSGVIEGKIIPKAATTLGGNVSDSIYMKITLYSGTVTFKSYSVPVKLRADPEVERFAWKYDSVTYDTTLDETYIISGYRFTGFTEDQY